MFVSPAPGALPPPPPSTPESSPRREEMVSPASLDGFEAEDGAAPTALDSASFRQRDSCTSSIAPIGANQTLAADLPDFCSLSLLTGDTGLEHRPLTPTPAGNTLPNRVVADAPLSAVAGFLRYLSTPSVKPGSPSSPMRTGQGRSGPLSPSGKPSPTGSYDRAATPTTPPTSHLRSPPGASPSTPGMRAFPRASEAASRAGSAYDVVMISDTPIPQIRSHPPTPHTSLSGLPGWASASPVMAPPSPVPQRMGPATADWGGHQTGGFHSRGPVPESAAHMAVRRGRKALQLDERAQAEEALETADAPMVGMELEEPSSKGLAEDRKRPCRRAASPSGR